MCLYQYITETYKYFAVEIFKTNNGLMFIFMFKNLTYNF